MGWASRDEQAEEAVGGRAQRVRAADPHPEDQAPDLNDGVAGADRETVPRQGEGRQGKVHHEDQDQRALRLDRDPPEQEGLHQEGESFWSTYSRINVLLNILIL